MLSKAEVDAIKLKQLEDARKPQPGILDNPIVKTIIGAGTGYLAGGLLPAIIGGLPGGTAVAGPVTAAQSAQGMTTLPKVGGGVEAALAPRTETLLPAVEGALKGLGSKTPEEAVIGGVEKGALPTIQAGETAAMKKFGLVPSTVKGATGDISYGKPGLTYEEVLKQPIPTGMVPTYSVGKGGASVKFTKPAAKSFPVVSMGRLSKKGAEAFSTAQAALNSGTDLAKVTDAVSKASDIPASEKPIILKNLKAKKSARTR